jgi:U3 small nucleolar RNA-associated protein 13
MHMYLSNCHCASPSIARCIAVATGHTEAVGSTTLSRKLGRYEVTGKAASNGAGCFAVTASKDRTIKRWNLPGATELDACGVSDNADMLQLGAFASARAHDKDINIVSVAPNDSLVATGSQDKTVRLWKSTDLTLQATLRGHRRGVWDCQFSPFDRVVATASGDRTVKLWSLGDYSCVRTFQGHVASALRVRFLCGGLQLLSSGADGLVKLWTIRTNECVGTMDGHIDKVWALDMSSDGSTFVSGGADSRIVIWNDTTQAEENMKRATEEQNILMEQKLANHLRYKEYEQALEIALQLEKPLQALKVLNSIVENDVQKGQSGLETLQRHVKGWSMARTTQILRYCRDWNTRARNCHMAMLVLKAIVSTIPAHTLAAAEGVPEILAGITPYAERHFDRLDRLHASTYLLDFALFSMGSLDMEQDDAKAFAEWESKSKMVLPPKQTDGRIQVGGTAFVGRDAQGVAEDDDEVVTIGESDSSDDDESSSTSETSEDDDNNNVGVADEQGGHSKKGQDFSSSSSESDSETS